MKKQFFGSCSGQGLTEYAVILSLVAVASISSMAFFGAAIKGKVASLSGAIAGQDSAEIKKSEQKAKNAATEAYKSASKTKGNTSISESEIFGRKTL